MFSYVCKVQIIEADGQLFLKPKRPNSLTLDIKKKSGTAKKCLFGVADPKDTEIMMQEQQEIDNQRFVQRFGFSVEDLENLEKENTDVSKLPNENRKLVKCSRKIIKAKRKALNSFNNQAVLTDFFKAKKSVHLEHTKDKSEN